MSEQEADIVVGDPDKVDSNPTDTAATTADTAATTADTAATAATTADTAATAATTADTAATTADVDKEEKEEVKSVDDSSSVQAVSGQDISEAYSTTDGTESVAEAHVSKIEGSNVGNIESVESQAEVTAVEDTVVVAQAEVVSNSVSEPSKLDDSSNQTKLEETSAAQSQDAIPAAEQAVAINTADIKTQSAAPATAAVANTSRDNTNSEAVATSRNTNKTTQDVTKMSGNDELKFGVLIGLVRVGQLSNKEVVDSVLSLVSMALYVCNLIF
jgi:hypothetical protein